VGLSPAQLHSLSARGEAREIADLGEHHRGGGEADAGIALSCRMRLSPAKAACSSSSSACTSVVSWSMSRSAASIGRARPRERNARQELPRQVLAAAGGAILVDAPPAGVTPAGQSLPKGSALVVKVANGAAC